MTILNATGEQYMQKVIFTADLNNILMFALDVEKKKNAGSVEIGVVCVCKWECVCVSRLY